MPHPSQIPLTPQTDERNFPRWEGEKAAPGRPGARYPKMLTTPATREYIETWKQEHRRVDQTTGKEYYEDRSPRLHSLRPLLSTPEMVDAGLAEVANREIIVESREEEERVRVFLGLDEPAPKPQTSSIPIRPQQVVNDELPQGWVVEEEAPVKPKGRPRGSKNKPKVNVSN